MFLDLSIFLGRNKYKKGGTASAGDQMHRNIDNNIEKSDLVGIMQSNYLVEMGKSVCVREEIIQNSYHVEYKCESENIA